MRKLIVSLAVGLSMAVSSTAFAAGNTVKPIDIKWSFEGLFGTFDRGALHRGSQVFFEVCNGCHSMDLVSYRNLVDIGIDEDAVKALAADYEVEDGPNEEGEMFMRPARYGTLSLLMRCLLASLMVHLLLLLLFAVWDVTAALAGEFNRRGKIRVALAPAAGSGDIARQKSVSSSSCV